MERVLNYTQARQNLKAVMDTVIEDRVAVVITRKTSEPVVMMAKSEHDSMVETYHLLRSPLNAERLRQAIAEVEAGEIVTATLRDGLIEEKQ
ncbi:MAG: type II toxin-antitoxin system Phd/YefM family antitoxin [Gammaproteobacteria bacterium]|nr:type II toxin-antitoxin system Phd/YefM family antitoxin [Gammaproteobacteria bacterium]MDE0442540.1 type II toxin-antitoxin system Phd/YefM family antitoxin [Gammaproteobacteria bacterium]